MNKKDSVIKTEKWVFDEEVSECFDDMLERSIPQYKDMRCLVFDIGKQFAVENTNIIDIGCSKGDALEPFVREFTNKNHYIGIEVSKPMVILSIEKFKKEIEQQIVEIINLDLKYDYPKINGNTSLVLSILTLQFIPIEYRRNLLQNIYNSLDIGGALILVEKVLGNTAQVDDLFVDLYYKMKRNKGYSDEQIQRKKLSLEGVLVPITSKWNEEMLAYAGFHHVECFWRYLNFTGIIALK